MPGNLGLGCKDRETSVEGCVQLAREPQGSLGYGAKKQTTKAREYTGASRNCPTDLKYGKYSSESISGSFLNSSRRVTTTKNRIYICSIIECLSHVSAEEQLVILFMCV